MLRLCSSSTACWAAMSWAGRELRVVVPDAPMVLFRCHVGEHETNVDVTRHERAIRESGTAVHPHSDEVIGEDLDGCVAELKTGLGGRRRQFVE